MANADLRLMVIRPIGHLPAPLMIDQLCLRLADIEAPWLYNRAIDLRRFDAELSPADLNDLAARWRALRGKHKSFAHVAMIRLDACQRLHVPGASPGFPNETLCRFTSYHTAYGWLTATDPHGYLAALSTEPDAAPHVDRRRGAQPASTSEFLDA